MNTEIQNQEICRALVSRSVGECVSSLVTHFLGHPEALEGSDYTEDDLLELAGSYDYDEAAKNAGWHSTAEMAADDWADPGLTEDELKDWREDYAGADFINESSLSLVEAEDWEELCYDGCIDTDDYFREALEFWTVSGWFADRLKEYGEAVGEFFGLTIWGRGCSGQAIVLDSVIRKIAEDMDILAGQRNEWKV